MNEPVPVHVPGSFRDPSNRVFVHQGRILRAVNQPTLENVRRLTGEAFFVDLRKRGVVVETSEADLDPAHFPDWAGVLEHQRIPFISYPYEWSFSMLKRAALLQLQLVERGIENGWTLKDATAYNIQWIGAKPVFIDIPSFEPRPEGEPWLGYRQFCANFLIPLMLKAHLGVDYLPLLRSQLDGIPATEAAKLFYGIKRLKAGVLSHIVLPARVENRIASRERDQAAAQRRTGGHHSLPMVLGLVQSMRRLVQGLKIEIEHSDWSDYDRTHTYDDSELSAKIEFVAKSAGQARRRFVWDIGCNTGTFSRLCEPFADHVIAVDGDHNAVERLYLHEVSRSGSKILPLVMNLANISPSQGWGGTERSAFDAREKPDLVLALALIHHIRLSANIPIDMFLDWLRGLGSAVVIEFVGREDEMVVKLLTNKKEKYDDYNRENFVAQVEKRFQIRDRRPLKGGHRELFYLEPR